MGVTFTDGLQSDTALLTPLWLQHMANEAFLRSLKDVALFLPWSPGKQLETHHWVSSPLLKSMLAAATGLLLGSRPPSSETRYLWFHKWIRWGG